MVFSGLEIARDTKAFAAFREKYGPKPEIRPKLDWGAALKVKASSFLPPPVPGLKD